MDIKKQAQGSSYAFVQFTDINSVVRALRKMDGETIGANKIKVSNINDYIYFVTIFPKFFDHIVRYQLLTTKTCERWNPLLITWRLMMSWVGMTS